MLEDFAAIRAREVVDDGPGVEFTFDLLVEGDFAMGAENDLPEKADHAGFFEREAACDEGENRFGKEVIDVFGSFEGAGGFEEFGGDGHLR